MKSVAVLFAVLCAFSVFGDEPRVPKSDTEAIKGTWQTVGWRIGGHVVNSNPHRRTFDRDQVTFIETRGDRIDKRTATFRLDSAKSPKEIDIVIDLGNNKGQITSKGIYSLDDDVLLTCFGQTVNRLGQTGNRPKRFEARKGDDQELTVLIREDLIPAPRTTGN